MVRACLTMAISVLIGLFMIEFFLRYDDYSSLAVDYDYHIWEQRERRVMASIEKLDDPREAIVVLGDSMVAGVNCGHEQNLVGQFERVIQPKAPEFKAINLGTANSSVYAYLDQLQGYETAYGPPAGLIVMLYANDVEVVEPRMCPVLDAFERADGVTSEEKAEARLFCEHAEFGDSAKSAPKGWFSIGGPLDAWLHKVSYAHRFFRQALSNVAVLVMGDEPIGRMRYPGLWSDDESSAFRMIRAGLLEIEALANKHEIPTLIAFFPSVEHLSRDNPMYEAAETARQSLEAALDLPVLNGFEAFLDDPRAKRNMSRSLTDQHPSCLAHEILAEWLADRFDEIDGGGVATSFGFQRLRRMNL